MARIISQNVYRFHELTPEAKQRVKDREAATWGYNGAEDAIKSLRKLAEHFGGKLHRYGVDFFNSSPSHAVFIMPEMDAEEIGRRLAQLGTYDPKTLRGNGDCKLTGYCIDEDAIDGFRAAFLKGDSSDLDVLMAAAFDSWLKAVHADCEDQYSDETFGENADANDREYYEDGRLYRSE